ncbi:MAG TPA: Ig-like domain-containing protein [Gemmatimonadaceae bacterium]|nr:Ig-like domain-containing protein [Gemmatimonadaceae bacterium]
MRTLPPVATVLVILSAACSDAAAPHPTGPPDAQALAATSTTVGSVTVSPSSATVAVGATQQFTATVKDVNGNTLSGQSVAWSSSDTSVVKVNSTGLATGRKSGSAYVRAKSGGVVGRAAVTVVSATTSSTTGGVPLGPFHLPEAYFSSPYTGTVVDMSPSSILTELAAAKAAHQRIVLRLARHRSYFQNSDGSFSLSLWKQEMDRFKGVNFSSYITDGTIVAHYLFDEPQDPTDWNGKVVPYSDVEAAAAYSKQLWPGMPTVIRSPPSWLAGWSQSWTSLDASWVQYVAGYGSVSNWIANETTIAARLKLGVLGGVNAINGGNGSSGIPGSASGKWAMSASELQSYGKAILSYSVVCGFVMWEWDKTYFNRTDIKNAVASLATIAKSHTATPCR